MGPGWDSEPEKGSEPGQALFSAPNCADLKGSALAAETIHAQVFVGSVGFSLVLEERVTGSLLSLRMLGPGLPATAAALCFAEVSENSAHSWGHCLTQGPASGEG